MKNRLWLICFLGLGIASCKIGKPYSGSEILVPESFRADNVSTGDPSSQLINTADLEISESFDLTWWSRFEDPVLDTLIKRSLVYNRNVMIAAERILQSRYALRIQNAELLPKFGVQASGERGNFLFNQIGQVNELFIAGSGLNWEIDFWGRLRNLSDAARFDLLASEYGLKSVQLSLVAEVSSTYFQWLRAKDELEIAQRNYALRDSVHQIIIARFNQGIIQQTDVDQSLILKAIAEGAVPRFERKKMQLENALSFLIGSNPSSISQGKALVFFVSEVDEMMPAPIDLLKNRPDVLSAEYELMKSQSMVGVARAQRLPTISLTGTAGIITDDFGDWSLRNPLWNVGGQIMGPLFFWGQLKRQVDIAYSQNNQAFFAYENTILNAFREVEDAKIEIKTLHQEIAIMRVRKSAALNAQYLSGERYNQGVTSYLEFLESQRQAFDAELELVALKQSLMSAYAKLYKATGGNW
ncbi:TolC family protein [Mongoliitalea daihaiensis]|jgi:outer membrane protein, multidrug efflux system|uniref:TolC family protein n=1 Tax=Mongoliitalea daihaiensis TaxID=2782006 RepID=UPI001F303D9A|nr:TolC family protein [Mongoliitalea daihaiensis]UJP65805.1 TolC family protein [Mongoliitalea daihaiensis]